MTKRFKINALAALIVCAGGFSLSGTTPAAAASFDGCTDYITARTQAINDCISSGGKSLTIVSGSCSSTGYSLNTECHY